MTKLVGYKRDGEWQSFGGSIKGIVIGYDLIPLIGLGRMRRRLEAKGSFHRLRVVASASGRDFCLFRGNMPEAEFLIWGGPYPAYGPACRNACGFIDSQFDGDKYLECWRLWTSPDRTWRDAAKFLAAEGYSVRRVRLVESAPVPA